MSSLCICECPTLIGRIGGGGGGGGGGNIYCGLWCSCSFKRVRNLISAGAGAGYHLTVKYRNPGGGQIKSDPAWPETDPARHTAWALY